MFSNHFDYASFREGFTIFRVFLVFCVTHYHRYVPCVVVTAPPILSSFITYHWIVKKNTTVGATSKALAEHPRSPPVLVWFQILSLQFSVQCFDDHCFVCLFLVFVFWGFFLEGGGRRWGAYTFRHCMIWILIFSFWCVQTFLVECLIVFTHNFRSSN